MHEETKIEMKLEEETKPIKKICEKVMDIVSVEFEKGAENVDTKEMGEAIDILKDLYEAKEKIVKSCYYKYILAAMEKEETEEEETKKIMEKMREEYNGEDEDMERRFYDNYRYKRTGRYAPKGRGTYVGRRGYTEPMYHMPLDMYHNYSAEELRDMDRENMNRLYYTDTGMSGNSGNMGGSRSNSGNSGNSSGSTRSYTEGYDDGQKRGYSEGYERGRNEGSRNNSSRYENAKRSYQEVKSTHNSDSAEDKKMNMKEIEKVIDVVMPEIRHMIADSSPEVKSLVKTKISSELQKI